LALWITTERAEPGPVFGSKGKQRSLPSPATQSRWIQPCRSFHRNWNFPRYVRVLHLHTQRVETYGVPRCRFKNDVDSDYPFPRIMAMQGDGKTSYDVSKDGVPTQIGECTVCTDIFWNVVEISNKQTIQADYRRSKVATKLKVIYVKDTVLDVRRPILSLFNPHSQ